MEGFVRTTLAAAATVLVVGGFGGCGFLQPPRQFSDETTIDDTIASIELTDPAGSVTVRGVVGATETSIERRVSYFGQERSIGETHSVGGDTLELGGCGRRCSIAYVIEVPDGVDVNGSTANGSIRLRAVGEVDVQTNNGRIELEDIAGDVQVETSNGRIDGRDLNGDGVRAVTSNGAIQLELGTGQDVEARTSNGGIRITVPEGDTYRVTADTSNGRTDIGVANDADGRFSLELHTSNGPITVDED